MVEEYEEIVRSHHAEKLEFYFKGKRKSRGF